MKDPRSQPPTPVTLERRRWATPLVQTTASLVGPALLCSTGQPVVCPNGCCDNAPDCSNFCGGG